MKLKPDTLSATLVLGTMTAMVPLATDIYLPSMPDMAKSLSTTPSQVQMTLSAFLFGYAIGQVIYGPVSDKYGRRPALVFSFILFTLASIVCTLANSIETLIAARVVQALGGAGPVILARAIVRDLYEGPRAGRELSRMGAIMGFTPAVAPVFGAVLQEWYGWRGSFFAVAFLAAAFGAFVIAVMPETLRVRRPEPVSPLGIARSFGILLRNRPFRVYATLNALAFSGLFAFISGGSFILQGVYGLTTHGFALAFGAGCLSYVVGSTLASRVVQKRGLGGSIMLGVTCLALGGLGQLAGVLALPREPLALIIPMMLYMTGIGFTLPASMASALTPFPERAGAASSFLGLAQTLAGATIGLMVGLALGTSALPLPVATAAMGALSFALFTLTRRVREAD